MKACTYLALGVALLLMAGCATTVFKPFEARINSFEGKGGTKTTVDGMDIWDNGDPPRRYKILGILEDERPNGPIAMASLMSDIVQKAKEAEGDAVIQISSESQLAGMYSTGSAFASGYGNSASAYGSSVAVPIGRRLTKFAVIRFE